MKRLALLAFLVFGPNDGGAGGGGGGAGSGGAGGSGGGAGGAGGGGGNGLTWETFHGGLTDEQKALIEANTSGLKTALTSERTAKGELEKKVRELAGQAEKGSESEKQLTALADQLKAGEKQAAFYETIGAAGVKNLRLAWAAANGEAKYWKGDGSLDLDAFKKDFPELFGAAPNSEANAGAGAGQGGGGKRNMNDWIREAAGR